MKYYSLRIKMLVFITVLFLSADSAHAQCKTEAHAQCKTDAQYISDYNKIIEEDPSNSAAYFDRGSSYYSLGKFSRAISDFTRAIEISPNNLYAYFARGRAYRKQKKYDEAISDITKAIEFGSPQSAVYYTERAEVYYEIKEYDKAWADVHKAEKSLAGYHVYEPFLAKLKKDSWRDE
jgi:tetratricopeptide (TPR) repeat protein